MYTNKKGLSTVIATVLIVLLALIATLFVWGFVSGIISGASEESTIANLCLKAELSPRDCELRTGTPLPDLATATTYTGGVADVTVQVQAGGPVKARIILEDANGLTAYDGETPDTIDVLGSARTTGILATDGGTIARTLPIRAKLFPVIIDDNGEDQLCTQLEPIVVNCDPVV